MGEYVEASRIIKLRFPLVEFCMLGPLDVQNPSTISSSQMDTWIDEGVVRYLGTSDDVRGELEAADCIVLPSYYREGIPRTVVGGFGHGTPHHHDRYRGLFVRLVDDGVNGFLCRLQDVYDLSKKMEKMLTLNREERSEMGRRGREKIEREFDEQQVIDRYLEVISTL